MDIETRRLEYFVTLVDDGSFSRAASRLFISQPALSQQIGKLEREVGVMLIDRTVRPFSITPAGRDIYVQSKIILEHVNKIEDISQHHQEGMRGSIRLGVIPALLYSRIPALVRGFARIHPAVSISMERENTLTLTGMLGKGLLDVAITFARIEDGKLRSMKVFEDRFVVALPTDHPAAKSEAVDLGELGMENIIMSQRAGAPASYDTLVAACMQAGFSPNTMVVKGSYLDHISYVSAGFGVGIIPAGIARLDMPNVVYRPLRSPGISLDYFMSWSEPLLNPSTGLFIEHCIARAPLELADPASPDSPE
ncbi:LysR family transcriptional regulator [Paeniglutamicibacter sp. MACA_103]|uniref:LysR family transcriptional regulator n=1 Tax=Paeniglutamicibacter sp. MACA_103 TaxID=3377337 RepID=UPI003893B8AB